MSEPPREAYRAMFRHNTSMLVHELVVGLIAC
jgi:hypothetical protein